MGAEAAPAESFGLSWPAPFFPFQLEGIRRLLGEPALLLADEMGLGKTIQAAAALRVLFARGEVASALVVAPAGLVLQWRKQLKVWAPEPRLATVIGPAEERARAWRREAHIYLTSYDALRADLGIPAPWAPLRRAFDVVLLDEAQRIKNAKTDLAVVAKRLKRTRSWALTGTPLENRLDDLVSILDFVVPGRFDRRGMAAGLRRLLAEVQLRRRRADVLHDLPPKLATVLPLELGRGQRATYRRAEEEGVVRLRELGRELRISHVLELILRLKQICNVCPDTGESAKLGDLKGRLDAVVESGEKALVFTQFVAEPFGAERLKRELAPLSPILITGGLDPIVRATRLADFERDSDRRLMILSLKAGGVGLNLTSASQVVHFDRWWNPAVEAQAEDRAHRIGQTRPVNVTAYLVQDSIEERIDEILAEKRTLFSDVVDGVDMGALRRLDLETLLEALAPWG